METLSDYSIDLTLLIEERIDVVLERIWIGDTWVVPHHRFALLVDQELLKVPVDVPNPEWLIVQTRAEVCVGVLTDTLEECVDGVLVVPVDLRFLKHSHLGLEAT